MSAYFIQEGVFDPQRNQNSNTSSNSSAESSNSPTTGESLQTPPSIQPYLSTPTQTPEPESTVSGIWEGTYTCSRGITGVTIDIDQTENAVIADFSLHPVPENPNVPRGLARYEGNFNSTSRRMSFPRGIWINKPASSWTAFPFHGQFDENLKTFSGEMDGYRCTTINLKNRDG